MIVSTLQGFITKQEVVSVMEREGEVFYSVTAQFRNVTIPVLISEFIWSADLFGAVIVSGYLTRENDEEMLRVTDIKVTQETAPPTNEVVISGVIRNKQPYIVGKNGLEVQVFHVTYALPGTHREMRVKVVAKDSAARYFKHIAIGTKVEDLHGYLKERNGKYEIVLMQPIYK